MSRVSPLVLAMLPTALGMGLLAGLPSDAQEKANNPEVIAKLNGHAETVYSVAYSPDGKYLVTGSFDHTLKLWEAVTGKDVKTYGGPTGHQKMVLCATFSPDGQKIASGSADNTVKVWDVPVDSPIRSVAVPDGASAVALSADGTKLAVGDAKGSVKIVAAADFKELVKTAGHQGPIAGLAFSANGQVLASASADHTVRFWNVANGQLLSAVGAHAGAVNGVTISPAGPAYTVGDDGMLRTWQVPPIAPKALVGNAAAIHAIAVSADGNTLITGSEDKTVRHFATAAGKELRALTGPRAPVGSVALNPANGLIAAGSHDRRIYSWNATDGKPLADWLAHKGSVSAVQFHPQGTQLASGGADGLVNIWAIPPVPARIVMHPEGVQVAVASADGKKLFTGGADKLVRVWDIAKSAVERQFAGHAGPITALAVSANGQVIVSGGTDATIRFWNPTTGKESAVLSAHAAPITSLALNSAASQLVSTAEDGTVKLWQVPPIAAKAYIHPDQVTSLALTADHAKLVTGSADKVVRLWNLASGAKEREYPGGPSLPITAVALSPDGTNVAAVAVDKTLTLWNASTGKVLHKITLPAAAQAVAFSPDNLLVAVGVADGTVKLLKVADAKESKTLAGDKAAVTALAFAPKGDILYSAGANKTVQSWALPAGLPGAKLDHDAPITGMAVSKDGTLIAAVGAKSVKVWNASDGKLIAAWAAPAESNGIAVSPDKTRIVLAGADKVARVYKRDGRLVESFVHDGPVHTAAFLDSRRVVTAAADKTARLWTSALVWQKPHDGAARRAFFTPKGDQVISAGDDKAIRIWNAADGKEIKVLANPEGAVTQIGLSADGTRLASAGAGKSAKVWTLADGKVIANLPMTGPATALAFSPNGQRVAVALAEGKEHPIHVLDVALGREVQTFDDHTAAVASLAFQADNRTLVSASLDKSARLLDAAILAALPAHAAGPVHLQYHSSGAQLLTGGADKSVKIWDLAKSTAAKSFGPLADPVRAVAYSKDFTQVAAAAGKVVTVWNIADGKQIAVLSHPAEVLALAFNQDKTRIATGAADRETRLWEVATGRQLQFFAQAEPVEAVAVTTAGVVVSAAGKTVQLETPSILRVVVADAGPVYAVAMTPSNTHILTAGTDTAIKMWNVTTGVNERTFTGATAPLRAVAVAKNNLLVAAAGADQTVRVYQLADGKELGAVKVGGTVGTLAFTPNSAVLLGGVSDKAMVAWGTAFTAGQPAAPDFLKPVQSYTAAEPVQQVTMGIDNATFYSAGAPKAVHAWKLAAPAPTSNFAHPNNVDAVAFQPKGTLLATGGHDGKVRLFDPVKNALVKEITAHVEKNVPSTIYTIAFTNDGKQLLTSSLDRSVKLWDVPSGNLVREFKAHKPKVFEKGHQDPVYAAALSPDGKLLATGSGGIERVIKLWNVADGAVVRDLANPHLKTAPSQPPSSHPGDVLHLHFTRDGKLISLGDAPKNKGFLAVWDPPSGKMLYGETLPMGTFFGMAVAPDERTLAIATGSRGKAQPELNNVYLLKLPSLGK